MNTEQQLLFMNLMSQAQQQQQQQRQTSSMNEDILQRLTWLINNNANYTNSSSKNNNNNSSSNINNNSCTTTNACNTMPNEYSYLPRMRIPPLPYSLQQQEGNRQNSSSNNSNDDGLATAAASTSNPQAIDLSGVHFTADIVEPVPFHPSSTSEANNDLFNIMDQALNEVIEDVDDDDFIGQQVLNGNLTFDADPMLSSPKVPLFLDIAIRCDSYVIINSGKDYLLIISPLQNVLRGVFPLFIYLMH